MIVWLIKELAVIVLVSLVPISTNGIVESAKLLFDKSPDGVDHDDNYHIQVTVGEEVIDSTLTRDGHHRSITVTVFAFDQLFVLDMKLNTYLFAARYIERSVTKDGIIYHNVNHTESHCYYLGSVRGQPQSTAAVSTCNGIVGHFVIGNVSYHIDPRSDRLHGPHKVYRSRDDAKTIYRCGDDQVLLSTLFNPAKHDRKKRSFLWPQDLDKTTKVVELFVANDYSQFVAKGATVIQRTKEIVNIASSVYSQINIYLVLVGIETWTVVTNNIAIVDPTNKTVTLSQWGKYRMEKINPFHYNDNAVLLMNKAYENGGIVGLANYGGMCGNNDSAAFVSDVNNLASVAGSIMSHEIGHNFGMLHDNVDLPCPCSDLTQKCIMNQAIDAQAPSITWSQCSLNRLQMALQAGLDLCLYNIPETFYQPLVSNCGNGIVEDGEQCDCGMAPSQQCNRSCCNSKTCQLIAPAKCAYGRCCNISTCQVLPPCSVCRTKDGDCDLEEYCNGYDSLCPKDTSKADGTKCTVNGVGAYCYKGMCRSRESQCVLVWGPGTNVSSSQCYDTNVEGKTYGNCGVSNWFPNVTYIPCNKSDILCGRLQCKDLNRQLFYYLKWYVKGTVLLGPTSIQCHSIGFDYGLDTQDPGLVPNGADCGNGQMCINQKCVNVSSASSTYCATPCQQNEVCNNAGQCQRTNCTPSQFNYTSVTTSTRLTSTQNRPSTTAASTVRAPSITIRSTSTFYQPSTLSGTPSLPDETTSSVSALSAVLGIILVPAAVTTTAILLAFIICCRSVLISCCRGNKEYMIWTGY